MAFDSFSDEGAQLLWCAPSLLPMVSYLLNEHKRDRALEPVAHSVPRSLPVDLFDGGSVP